MTGIKNLPAQTTSKLTPKKAVTFTRAVKFAPASPPPSTFVKSFADSCLQGNKRRKYMRRGSKTPAMLLLTSKMDFDALVQDRSQSYGSDTQSYGSDTQSPPSDPCSEKNIQDHQHFRYMSKATSQRHPRSDDSVYGCFSTVTGEFSIQPVQQVRRLSMMSVLKQNLEKTSISSEKAQPSSLHRRLSLGVVR